VETARVSGHLRPTDLRSHLRRTAPGEQDGHIRTHLDTCLRCWTAWNRFRWDQARTTSLYAELAEFLGEDFQPYFDSSHALAHEWDAADPRTDREMCDFFRTSTSYLYNLAIWEASGNRPDYLSAALPVLRRTAPANILDYGCGIGSDTLALLNEGFTVFPCDYHSPSTEFLRWRGARIGSNIEVAEPGHLSLAPDVVWTIDTLDHLADLDRQLGPLLDRTRLVISEHIRTNRSHGQQRFHHRRAPALIVQFFGRYGFVRTGQPNTPVTVWTKRSP
jgi:hypothetical protein